MITNSLAINTLASQLLLAAPNDSHGFAWTTLWAFINLAIIVTVGAILLRKPVKNFFKNRHDTIAGDIEAAQKQLQNAQSAHDEAQKALNTLDETVAGYEADLKRELQDIRQSEESQAALLRQKLEQELTEKIAQEKRQINQKILDNLVQQLFEQARLELSERANMNIHKQIISNLLEDLDSHTGSGIKQAVKGNY